MSVPTSTKTLAVTALFTAATTTGALAALYGCSKNFRNFCGRTFGAPDQGELAAVAERIDGAKEEIANLSETLESSTAQIDASTQVIKCATIAQQDSNEQLKVTNATLEALRNDEQSLLATLVSNNQQANARAQKYKEQIGILERVVIETESAAERAGYKELLKESTNNYEELSKKYNAVLNNLKQVMTEGDNLRQQLEQERVKNLKAVNKRGFSMSNLFKRKMRVAETE